MTCLRSCEGLVVEAGLSQICNEVSPALVRLLDEQSLTRICRYFDASLQSAFCSVVCVQVYGHTKVLD